MNSTGSILRAGDKVSIARKHHVHYGRVLRVTGRAVVIAWLDQFNREHRSTMVPDDRIQKCEHDRVV